MKFDGFKLSLAAFMTVLALVLSSCRSEPEAVPVTVKWLVGPDGSFSERLARSVAGGVPGVAFDVKPWTDTPTAVAGVQDGSADLTVTTADEPYFLDRTRLKSGAGPSNRLNALLALQLCPFHVVLGPKSSVRNIDELHDKPVWLSNQRAVSLAMGAFGANDVHGTGLDEAALAALASGRVEAIVVAYSFPSAVVENALRVGGRLLAIEGPIADRLLAENPLISRTVIPAGTYPGQTANVRTIGMDLVLVTREGLDGEIAYAVTRKVLEVLPQLTGRFPALLTFDTRWAPATPIPLHPASARFFRELELRP